MRGEWKRVLLGCAASLLPRGGGTPASQRVAEGSRIGRRGRLRRASLGKGGIEVNTQKRAPLNPLEP